MSICYFYDPLILSGENIDELGLTQIEQIWDIFTRKSVTVAFLTPSIPLIRGTLRGSA